MGSVSPSFCCCSAQCINKNVCSHSCLQVPFVALGRFQWLRSSRAPLMSHRPLRPPFTSPLPTCCRLTSAPISHCWDRDLPDQEVDGAETWPTFRSCRILSEEQDSEEQRGTLASGEPRHQEGKKTESQQSSLGTRSHELPQGCRGVGPRILRPAWKVDPNPGLCETCAQHMATQQGKSQHWPLEPRRAWRALPGNSRAPAAC